MDAPLDISLIAAFQRGLMPDPIMTATEWADNFRMLPQTSAEPGKFRSSRTPYVVEILNKLSVRDPAQKIFVMKGSQVAFTETGNNWLGYIIDVAPGPMLYVMPTDLMMKDTSKNRIQPMINSTPALAKKIIPEKSRDKGNTIQYKEFEGGFGKFVGANSPVGLSSTAVRYVYLDEVDRYPLSVGGEGSALSLAETRTMTFGARKKIFYTSTPTRKGTSAIDTAFNETGQRYYNVPCPHCGGFQVLEFSQLRYEQGKYDNVQYECSHCNELIAERHKPKMLKDGMWIAKHPEKEDGITFGYHLSAMYSPYGWYSWAQMVKDFDESEKDLLKKIVFVNTKLGLCYEEEGEKPNWESLYDRAEDYPTNIAFKDVAVITAGVDIQGDRIEIELVGWMKGMRSQQIDYRVLIGDTTKPEVWEMLTKIVYEQFKREDGCILPVRMMAVDSGYNTKKVYDFVKKHSTSRVIAVKGRDKLDMIFSSPKQVTITKAGKKIGGTKVWGIGSSFIKSEIYGMLKVVKNHETGEIPDGYCHFPKREPYYFRGITAEELQVITNRRGFREYVWVKNFDRNEPLDTRVYARAAAAVLGVDRWEEARFSREVMNAIPDPEETKTLTPPAKKAAKRKSSFWDK